jgi:hypothetical protein
MAKTLKVGNAPSEPPPPPPQVEPNPALGVAGNAVPEGAEPPIGHPIAIPEQVPAPFIVRLTGIEDAELQRREVHITKMGSSPEEDWEIRKAKAFDFMNTLWDRASEIVTEAGNALATRMQAAGKEFSESAAQAMVFINLLTKNVSSAKCVSCQMPTSSGLERRFFPIEIVEKPGEYVNMIRKFAAAVKELPGLGPDFLRVIREAVVKDLDDDCLEERDREVKVLTAADWCDARLVLKPNDLKDVVKMCGKSYIEYRQATQIQDNAQLFEQFFQGGSGSQSQVADANIADLLASMDFNFDL